ncbi:hypothetical protein [Bradyrhizobium canariense]|uniref:Uncharacterized protein n=1 Tax=Bradyrhizobium canariense TaxID=255045 RepID=A0A1H1MGI4_9BRAD|nr:hypothetical protein [Bradyrhizobium canariense]SDR85951.1 hypothetical protein SAMN05444158_0221 [Bradyrhizobium canariense]
MASQKLAFLVVALVAFTAPAAAQTGGGSAGGTASTATTTGGTSTESLTTGSGRGSAQPGSSGDRQDGINADGSIGQTGKVGTSLNGKPIGSPGSGLGSPEDSVGAIAK